MHEDDRYSFTSQSVELIRHAGLTPETVWSAVQSGFHLLWPYAKDEAVLFAQADSGEYLAIGLHESPIEDNDWDIIGARPMDADEKERFTTRRPKP